MSRASDYIAAVEAEGHKLMLHLAASPADRDILCTDFYPHGLDYQAFSTREEADAAMDRTDALRPRSDDDKRELREELIRRGLVY